MIIHYPNIHFDVIPDYGDHMTFKDFKNSVDSNLFINDDGHGRLATENCITNILVYPSDLTRMRSQLGEIFGYVVWFNK